MNCSYVMQWPLVSTPWLLLLLVCAAVSSSNMAMINETVSSGPPDEALENLFKLDSTPNWVVKDANGQPCILATINATMKVSYEVAGANRDKKYWAPGYVELPKNASSHGVCGQNVSNLILKWENGTFGVNLTFAIKEVESKDVNSTKTWYMTDIEVTYSLANKEIFKGAITDDTKTVEGHKLSFFKTPVGSVCDCGHDITIQLGGPDRHVDITVRTLQLAVFGVVSDKFPSDFGPCPDGDKEDDDDDDENVLVPLIIACFLCAAVLIIVLGYVITKKLEKDREHSEYRPM